MRRSPPLRHYLYVRVTIWAVVAIMFALWALIADGPGPLVAVPVLVAVTIAGIVSVKTQA